jgi:hypothetical protein
MLINTIRRSFRDMIGYADTIQPIVTVENAGVAANVSDFSQAEMRARRLRRQGRLDRAGRHGNTGWRLRAW